MEFVQKELSTIRTNGTSYNSYKSFFVQNGSNF